MTDEIRLLRQKLHQQPWTQEEPCVLPGSPLFAGEKNPASFRGAATHPGGLAWSSVCVGGGDRGRILGG